MKVENFVEILGADFFTGVPDSLLKCLCNYLMDTYGSDPRRHLIAANEGNCVAVAAGYHLATGKVPVVYMQNSGEGNALNPLASLMNRRVYAIPVILVVGWRGEPGLRDEPQHEFQGSVTLRLLDDLGIRSFVIGRETTAGEVRAAMYDFRNDLADGGDVAFVIRKGALSYDGKPVYRNGRAMRREEIIRHIVRYSGGDPIVSTTGKTSRELFETRTANGQDHRYDFLTVGSMGHSSSIALGIALHKPRVRVWCLDGDGAAIMHMGALAVIGAAAPANLVHIVINNESHESVGGLPTAAGHADLTGVARACGYPRAVCVDNFEDLDRELAAAKAGDSLSFIEVRSAIGAREDLGRPTSSPAENRRAFAEYLSGR